MLPTFSLTLAEDVAYAHEYARRWRGMLPSERADGAAFLAALDAAEAEVSSERYADQRAHDVTWMTAAERNDADTCTGTLWAVGEDGMEVVDHDGDCPVHDPVPVTGTLRSDGTVECSDGCPLVIWPADWAAHVDWHRTSR